MTLLLIKLNCILLVLCISRITQKNYKILTNIFSFKFQLNEGTSPGTAMETVPIGGNLDGTAANVVLFQPGSSSIASSTSEDYKKCDETNAQSMETEEADDFDVTDNTDSTEDKSAETKTVLTIRIFSESATEKLGKNFKEFFDLGVQEALMDNQELFEEWSESTQETCNDKGTLIITSNSPKIADFLKKLADEQELFCTITTPEKKALLQTFIPSEFRGIASLDELKKFICFASKITPENFEFLSETKQEDKKSKRKGSFITIRVNEAGIQELTKNDWRIRTIAHPKKYFLIKFRDSKLEWSRKKEMKEKQNLANAEYNARVQVEREETRKRKREEIDPLKRIDEAVLSKASKRNLSSDECINIVATISKLNQSLKLAENSGLKNFEQKARLAAVTYAQSKFCRKEDSLNDISIGATFVLAQLTAKLRLPIRGYETTLGLSSSGRPSGWRVARKISSGIKDYFTDGTCENLLERAKQIKTNLEMLQLQ